MPDTTEEVEKIDTEKLADEFVSRNPFPILRAGKDGTVLYANKAATPLLKYWGIRKGEKLPHLLRQSIKRVLAHETEETLELCMEEKIYCLLLYTFSKAGYVNIQGFDTSLRVLSEEKLRISQQELGKLVERKTSEYERANKKLEYEAAKRKKIEKTLSNNMKFLETLLNTIPEPIFYKDSEGKFFGCNNIFARQILGRKKEEIIGKALPEVYKLPNSELPFEIHKNDLEFLLKEGRDNYETEVICADGMKRDFLVSRTTFSDEEENARKMVAVLLDLTELRQIENELQNNVRFLETLLDSIPSPIFQRDLTGTYVNCNESFAMQIMGLHKEKVIGGTFAEFEKRIPKELAEIYKRDARQLLENGGTQYYETKVTCADNVQRDFFFHKATYKDSSGKIAGVVGVMLDITQLKEAEKSSREGEERYRIAAEQTGQIVYDYNGITDKIEWAGAVRELTGYSLEEFKKFNLKDWEIRRHPDDRKAVLEKLKSSREKGEKFKIGYRFKRKDGSYFYVEDSGVFLKDEHGKSYRAIGVMKDITEIKLASEKLRKSEARYRSLMKNFRGIVFQQKFDFILLLMDGSVEEITGYIGEDFISRKVDWSNIVLSEDRKTFFENRKKLVNYPLPFIEQEYRIKRRNGKIRWVREVIQNIFDSTDEKRILQGAIYDITKQKEAEESLAKIEEIRKKEIHHRIKNNLQVISSLLELQAEKFNEKEVLEAFHESKNRVASMAIIHEELYKSKNNETFDFSEYLKKLTATLFQSYTVREGDVKIYLDIEEIFFGMDTAVPLGIIINELVSNSLKHAFPCDRKGEIRIKLCRMEEIKENESISSNIDSIASKIPAKNSSLYKLSVSDNGLGFPEAIDFKNTGSLGLQLVNILVEQLEGTIELEKDEETVFRIFFKENS